MKYVLILAWVFVSFLTISCSKNTEGTSTGNPLTSPLVSIQFKSYSALSAESFQTQSVSNLKMCFKRLRFKPVSGSDDDFDLELGEVTIVSSGTTVASVAVPPGTYERVEFDLESDECASGKTIQVINSHGSFSTSEDVRIRFEGRITIATNQTFYLDIQSIVSALGTVTSNNEVDNKAESVSGSF